MSVIVPVFGLKRTEPTRLRQSNTGLSGGQKYLNTWAISSVPMIKKRKRWEKSKSISFQTNRNITSGKTSQASMPLRWKTLLKIENPFVEKKESNAKDRATKESI